MPSPQSKTGAAERATAVLALDAAGRIELANAAACTLWQARATELAGDHLPNLFAFEVTSRDPEWLQAQWEVLLAAASERPITLKLQPKEAAAFDATVNIEKAAEAPARYLAFIAKPAPLAEAPAPAPAAGAATPTPEPIFALLAERSQLGFFDLDFTKNEVYYSPAWKRMLGYTGSELPNTFESWQKLIHPEDSAAAPDRQGKAAAPGTRPFAIEFRMKHARGDYVWVQSAGVQIFGPNGALQRVLGVHLDIQDRKEFEEAALRDEERLQVLSERCQLGVFDLDFAADHYWHSAAWKRLIGYKDTELPDKQDTFTAALPKEDAAAGVNAYFLTKDPTQPAYFDTVKLRHREGRDVWVYAGIFRQFSRRRELQRVIGFMLPMPASQATAGAAQPASLSADMLAAMLAELREGVLLTDANSIIVFVNPKAEQLLSRPTGQIVGQHVSGIFSPLHRLSREPGENPVDKVLTTGEAIGLNDEFMLDLGAEKTVPVSWSCRPVLDPAGRAIGAALVFRNPEEMSLTPEELIRSNRFDSLGHLAGGIAHDFNNLLTTILGGVSLAKDSKDLSAIENSERACLAAKGLSKQLLTFAKGGSAVRQVVKPADILHDAARLAAAGSAVKVETHVAADTQTICVDRAQILQVFQNLIINAIQAMSAGQGNIWISAGNVALAEGQVPPLAAGNYVAVEVRDNGGGIKPENLQKIFDPFFTTKKTGTGLGLATVLNIVKRHGGQIGVDSEVGVGTTFTLFFPQADKPVEVEARRAPSLRFGTGRVLFMDDDPEICSLTATMLEGLGYKYDLAKNGEEALQFYKRYLTIGRPYDVVIMDLTIIGGLGGEQTYKRLRELDPDVRAIIASGYDSEDMARQFLDLGFCGYLTKPYRVGDLGRIIKTVLG